MAIDERPYQPPWTTRTVSSITLGTVGFLCRGFLYALNKTEVHGLDRFLQILDSRKDPEQRQRGLITVANHISVMDEPVIWGALPYRYHWDSGNMRYSLASYDIMFNKGIKALDQFFYHGNTLPCHRGAHSQPGGLFQPTMREAIRLLSSPHGKTRATEKDDHYNISDPFSDAELTYTTTGQDIVPRYSTYLSRKYSWIHIFPEGKIHQHPDKHMRYFKWGVARLILESDPCPDVLPIWIDGMQEVMDDKRPWPRALPRAGKNISIYFGELADREAIFSGFRTRWQQLKEKAAQRPGASTAVDEVGDLSDDYLRYSPEAQQLRIDVTMAVRNEVVKLRRSLGLSDQDPKSGLAETWRAEGSKAEGEMKDGSIVKDA